MRPHGSGFVLHMILRRGRGGSDQCQRVCEYTKGR